MARLIKLKTGKIEFTGGYVSMTHTSKLTPRISNDFVVLDNIKAFTIASYTTIDKDGVNGINEVEDENGVIAFVNTIPELYEALKKIF